MNSLALFERLVRNTTSPDIATAPVALRLCAVEKANEAFIQTLALLPSRMRQTTGSLSFGPPTTHTCTFISSQSGITFTPSSGRGARAAVLEGDATVNRLHPNGGMIFPYCGPLTGSGSATVYNDSAYIDRSVMHLCSRVVLRDATNARSLLAEYHQGLDADGTEPFATVVTGTPRYWRLWTLPAAGSADSGSTLFLQVWPFPVVKCRVEFAAEWSPTPFTLADTIENRVLPVHDAVWAGAIAAVAEAKMASERFWASPDTAPAKKQDAADALAALSRLIRGDATAGPRTSGTPPGY